MIVAVAVAAAAPWALFLAAVAAASIVDARRDRPKF